MKTIVIGGGIIGLCSAYYLRKEGHEVEVIDKSNMDDGASYVNAGYISPSHVIPLSAPGVVKKGIQWMLDPSSPFYVKPRLDLDFLRWAWAFNKSCNSKHVERAARVIRDISLLSLDLYEDLRREEGFSFHYEKKGLLMLCQTEQMLEEEYKVSKLSRELGLEVHDLNGEEVQRLEKDVKVSSVGATHFLCDAHTTPSEFMEEMKSHLRSNGVKVRSGIEVHDMDVIDGKVRKILTSQGELEADQVVMAAGSWTYLLLQKIGLRLLLQAGKGYRINCRRPTGIAYPAILCEAKAAVTPMNGFTRFAGTMEIAGISKHINPVRVEAISAAATRYYPELQLNAEEKGAASSGLRPLSPDGLPFIGKSSKCENLVIATGHAMMGWTMATATGKLVSEIISGKRPSMNLGSFHPERKF